MKNTKTTNRRDFRRAKSFATTSAIHRRNLVEEHADLVRIVARQIGRRHNLYRSSMDEEDLFSVGIMGLLEADKRFDEDNGTAFSSFAEFRIKGAMIDELRRKDVMPRRLRAKASKLGKTRRALEQRLGREVTREELAEAMEMTSTELAELDDRIDTFRFQPADGAIPLPCPSISPFQKLAEKQKAEVLARVISRLDRRLQLVLDLYFRQELTLREIGDILDVSEGRVSQLKSEAIKQLREELTEAA